MPFIIVSIDLLARICIHPAAMRSSTVPWRFWCVSSHSCCLSPPSVKSRDTYQGYPSLSLFVCPLSIDPLHAFRFLFSSFLSRLRSPLFLFTSTSLSLVRNTSLLSLPVLLLFFPVFLYPSEGLRTHLQELLASSVTKTRSSRELQQPAAPG